MATNEIEKHELRMLLPWHVNGTLSPEETAEVEALLDKDSDAAREQHFWFNLRQSIQAEEHGSPGDFGLRRLQTALQKETVEKKASDFGKWLRPAMAAAVLVMVVQAGMLVNLWQQEPAYQPAGIQTENRVQLKFAEDASELEIRQLLGDLGLEIVKGPSSVGIYRVAPIEEGMDLQLIVTQLREAKGIVTFAEME